jgi:DNA uptake protein ComE-like DNA-binding protein
MAQIEYITIKNASRATLNRLRKIGVEKAKRLQTIQERWEAGDYKDVEMVHV